MILRRIRIENFRKFRQPIVLDNLPGGLVVLAGENEDGKSTLLAALRAAFFSNHSWSGNLVNSFQPFGSEVAPEVEVIFEIAERRFTLLKRFCQRKFCRLSGKDSSWEGDNAEAELARLLGADEPGRAPKSGDETDREGPLALLWVKQGEAWRPHTSESASTGLRELLEAEVGGVLGGPRAETIVTEVSRLALALLTPTGKPTGDLKSAIEECALLRGQAHESAANAAAQDSQRDALQRDLTRLRELEAQLPQLLDNFACAQARSQDLANLQQRLDRLQQERKTREEKRLRLQTQMGQRTADRQRIEALRGQFAARDSAVAAAQSELDTAHLAVQQVSAEHQARRAELESAEKHLAACLHRADLDRAEAALADLETRHAAAGQAEQRQRDYRIAMQDLMDGPTLRKLTQSWEALQRAETQATHIELRLEAGVSATLDGTPLTETGPIFLPRRAQLDISSHGQRVAAIAIQPGPTSGEALDVDACRRSWRAAAMRYAVANLTEAQLQAEKRSALKSQDDLAARDLAASAPQGRVQLAAEIEDQRQRITWLQPLAAAFNGDTEAAVRAAVVSARDVLSQISGVHVGAQKDLDHASEKLLNARRECLQANEQVQTRQAELDRQVEEYPDDRLLSELDQASHALTSLGAQIEPIENNLRQLDPKCIAASLEMANSACTNLEHDIAELQRRLERSRGELAAAEPWAERREETIAKLSFVDGRRAELQLRADALKLLGEAILAARARAQGEFLGPVLQRVAPLAQRLLPGAEIHLTTDLQLQAVKRDARSNAPSESFDTLSLGTREQLAILVRLAFARLLQERGRPAITILDDAPAFADDARFKIMLGILHECAKDGQILVLTCREHEFRPSGAAIVRLPTSPVSQQAAGVP